MNKIFLLPALLFSLCLFCHSVGISQTPTSTASLFFETDKSELSAEARQTLDALAPALLNAPDYKVNIEAFTDDRGTEQYNLRLAADRAASVQNYLATKGLIADKTSVQNWGEQKAAGPTDLGRQKSRRVDVVVNSFFFEDFIALQERLSANTEQVLKIQPGQEQTVIAAKGTLVIVPANAFVFDDGTVPTGEVDLQVQEAFDPSDFVLHNLTTMSDGRILQTGGMVRITAQSGGRELQLADGASLTVSIPNGGDFDPSMELFYAQPVANGAVDWKPAGQKFRQTLKPSRIELTIDPALGKRIAAIKVPEYPKPALTDFSGQIAPEPKMPVAPYKPRAPKKPEWEEVQKMFAGGGEASRLSRKELKKAQKYFNELTSNYERDSAKYIHLAERYTRNVEGYEKAKLRYTEEHLVWENELKARLRTILLFQREMRKHCYSKSLAKVLKTKGRVIQKYGVYSNLYWAVDEAADRETKLMMVGQGIGSSSDQSKNRREASNNVGNLFQTIIGTKVIDSYKGYQGLSLSVSQSLPADSTSRVMSRMLAETGIKKISDSLQNELKEKTLLTSKSPEQRDYALKNYVATVSQLGWINCDRFYNDPAERMQVVVNETEDATLYAVCKDINAMLPFYRNGDGTYAAAGLPKGKKIIVVAIKIKDGMPQYAQHNIQVGGTVPSMAYRSMPLRDLKEELKKLNI
ncbi:MAG: OmpA family protein [Saprospiraceae bacterium]